MRAQAVSQTHRAGSSDEADLAPENPRSPRNASKRRVAVMGGRSARPPNAQPIQRVGGRERRAAARSSARPTSVSSPALSAASTKSCSSTSCCAWLPPSRCMPPSAGRMRAAASACRPARCATSASEIGRAKSRTMGASVPGVLAKPRMASIMRSAAWSRPVAVSAIIQCGSVKAERQSPIRASALSASSTQRSPTSTPRRSSRNSGWPARVPTGRRGPGGRRRGACRTRRRGRPATWRTT